MRPPRIGAVLLLTWWSVSTVAQTTDPAPVPGWPTPSIPSRCLHSLVLHPRFADNRTVYLTYVKSKDAQTAPSSRRRDRF